MMMKAMSSSGVLAVLLGAVAVAAVVAAQAPAGFDGNRAYEHLRQVVAIGPRPAGSPALESTRKYIKKQLADIGIQTVEQTFEAETPVGRIHMVNLIARIPGASADRIVFAGHYDTKLYREFRFVGANDAGSSTAFLLEWGRVMKARKNPLTVELLFLDGEEATVEWQGTDHTYGSRHYVEVAEREKTLTGLRALILVDMIADRDLTIRRESASTPWLTDAIWAAARRLKQTDAFLDSSGEIEDDHVPFLKAGVPAVDIIDGPDDYAPWHTAGDTLDKVSARSLQTVGDVLLAALPAIEKRPASRPGRDAGASR
jgi:Zn-dependent M28 family amino/carboxypeptidase